MDFLVQVPGFLEKSGIFVALVALMVKLAFQIAITAERHAYGIVSFSDRDTGIAVRLSLSETLVIDRLP